jgi:hypothetical protein
MAYGHDDVAPVRAPSPVSRRGKDGEENSVFKREHQRQQAPASRTPPQQAPVNVVELRAIDKERAQPPAPVRVAQHYVPFLAQQIAQEGMPDEAPEADLRRRHGLVSDAYVLASDDAANILGPVRPRELVV